VNGPGGSAVGRALPDESAVLHVTGAARFVDDLPEPSGTLHAVLVLSPVAHGLLRSWDEAVALAVPGVVGVVSAADIPGVNDCGTIVPDEPVLAEQELTYLGQPILAVVAESDASARLAAARLAATLRVDELPAALDFVQAHRDGDHVIPPMRMERSASGDVDAALAGSALAGAPRRLRGTFATGAQEHVYLETHASLAQRLDDGAYLVHSSTQHPTEVQKAVAGCVGVRSHQVRVLCRRMGGGFGGKESQAAQFACIAAVAVHRFGRPVKLRLDRATDNLVTGKRHAFWSAYEVGYDEAGRILGVDLTLVSQAGHSADLSGPVLTRAMCHVDNAYYLPEVRVFGYAARTNIQSSTAFRGFGGPQGALVIEQVVDSIARTLGRDPLEVRRVNLYGVEGDVTPYGEVVDGNVLPDLLDELVRTSDYLARRTAIAAEQRTPGVLVRGLALTPVKFGISFNVSHFNQAGALVHVYVDGSVLVNHSATEMGQGVNTKVRQVVADELGVPVDWVRSTATDTEKVANTSATAASTGSDMNGAAARVAARVVRDRLAAVAAERLGVDPADLEFADGRVSAGVRSLGFAEVTAIAYVQRVQLWSDGYYATPDLSWDGSTMQGRPFHYFCYGAAVTEVVIDTLTGETRVLRADVLYDAGRSLNPAVDLGQVEGAYVQGLGWLTQEEVRWDPSGRLVTLAPTTYKAPTANDVPPDLRSALFRHDQEPDTVHGSKAVGEPPLLLAFSAFLAIRDAISAVGGHQVDPPLQAPATPEEVLRCLGIVRHQAVRDQVGRSTRS
jgi:xanthine dehydrogenase large subunit